MDQSSGSVGPRVIDYSFPHESGGRGTGRIISGCQDSLSAIAMVSSLASSIFVIADENVLSIHRNYVESLAGLCAAPVVQCPIPSGEGAKSLPVLEDVLESMAAHNVDRAGVVIGFGGGVATDVAGMAAALWMRGVRLFHVPTSLLAMADAAIGGKCAVNIAGGRNLAGVVKFPEYVFQDRRFLSTLPRAEFVAGLVEIVKTGVVGGPGVLDMLATLPDWFDIDAAAALACESASVKTQIVTRDPFDRGVRALLNFGHTVGHAMESASACSIGHGRAVAAGMRIESAVSERLGMWSSADRGRLVSLLDRAGVESVPAMDFADVEPFMRRDKKNLDRQIRMALPRQPIGCGVPDVFMPVAVPVSLIRECWND